jgi:hypothetical protein
MSEDKDRCEKCGGSGTFRADSFIDARGWVDEPCPCQSKPEPEDKGRELMSCPFCLGKAEYWLDESDSAYPDQQHNVDCDNCDCNVGGYATKQEAITAWNTRPQSDKIERLEAELAEAVELINSVHKTVQSGMLFIDLSNAACDEAWEKINSYQSAKQEGIGNE